MQSFLPATILFLISPILSLAVALSRNVGSVSSRNVLWAFCCFYGMSFYIDRNAGVDAIRYREVLIDMHESKLTLDSFRETFYREGELNYDLYQPVLTFIVSRFTDDIRVLYAIFGFVLGFFYSRVIGFFIDQFTFRPKPLEYLLLVALAFTMNIGSALNGVRMYTAMFVFLYGALYYWQTGRRIYIGVAMSTVFIHFSYIIPIAVMLLLPFIQRLSLFVYLFYMGSFLFTFVQLEFLQNVVQALPLGIEWRVSGYLQGMNPEGDMPFILRSITWLQRLFRIVAVSHLFMVWYGRDFRKMIPLTFCMVLAGFVNVLSEVGSIGRFTSIVDLLLMGQILIHVHECYDRPDSRIAGGIVAGLTFLNTLLGVRFLLGYTSTNLLIGNPLTLWLFEQPDRSLYDYLPRVLSGL